MRSEHLKYLMAVEQSRSINAAAQEMYLGVSTLNGIVKSVEDELGFPLFKRGRTGVQPTAEGEEALAIIGEIQRYFDEIAQIEETAPGHQLIPVIISYAFNGCLPLPLNGAFLAEIPDGNLVFQTTTSEDVGQRIIKNDANIGITYFREEELRLFRQIAARYQIEVERLCTDSLYLLVRGDHPLAERECVSCTELKDLDIARLPCSSTSGDLLAYYKGVDPGNRVVMFSDVALIKRAVKERNMAAILPGYSIENDREADNGQFRVVELTDTGSQNELHMCLIRRADNNLRQQERTLLQCIRDQFS